MPESPSSAREIEVSSLSTEEKAALTGGADFWNLHGVPSQDLPGIMVSDGPHGLRTQHAGGDNLGLNDSVPATCFPPAVGISATWSRESAAAVGRALAEEALAEGVSVVLGPGMNIKRSPLCGRNFEYFSEDPHLTGEMAVAYVSALQEAGVGASVKHFALNNQETDRMRVDVEVDERTLHEVYLRAFRSVVTRAQPWTLMHSYNSVGGTTLAENSYLLTEVLRDQWGYEGVVVSDWGAVVDRPAAVAAGVDLQMPADPANEADLVAAVERGDVAPEALDRAAANVLSLIGKGLAHRGDASYDVDAHHAVALAAAERAIVLLENDGILPLAEDAEGLAVIGHFAKTPRYQGAGSSHVNPTRLTSAYDAISAIAGEVPFAAGFAPGTEEGAEALREEAVELARGAGTVLLFLGLGEDVESEGYDRTDMELPALQERLLEDVIAVNERVVVVLSNGSAIRLTSELRSASAVLEAWLLGQAGGEATANILFGRTTPSGKLAETIPLRLEDTPSFLHFPGESSRVQYGEGLFVGYRGLDAVGADVAYPFGHGLSYTTFAYSDLAVSAGEDGLVVELTVANTGERPGREVVQVYVSVPGSRLTRAPRELKGFDDVELAPGEQARLSIPVPAGELQHWDVVAGAWGLEGGDYRVEVGASSRDLRLSAQVEVAADEPVHPATFATTIAELTALPGGQEALEALLAASPGAGAVIDGDAAAGSPFDDPELAKMFEQIPVGRLVGLIGFSREQIQGALDAVNG